VKLYGEADMIGRTGEHSYRARVTRDSTLLTANSQLLSQCKSVLITIRSTDIRVQRVHAVAPVRPFLPTHG